jgi:hypothetical protein
MFTGNVPHSISRSEQHSKGTPVAFDSHTPIVGRRDTRDCKNP